jgi:DNA gyrase subunit B
MASDPIGGGKSPSDYSEETIEVLSSIEHIRRRPGMYLGSTDQRGLHFLFEEVLLTSVEAWLVGSCKHIVVELLHDGGCRVSDDGPGLPVNTPKGSTKRVVELWLGKSGVPGPVSYYGTRISHSLYGGSGLLIVNALSKRLLLRISQYGALWEQEYHRGVATAPLEPIGEMNKTGTSITFWPDPEIFQTTREFDFDFVANRCRELSFLHPGLEIVLLDQRGVEEAGDLFLSPRGAVDFVQYLNRNEQTIHPIIPLRSEADGEQGQPMVFEGAVQWIRATIESIQAYSNTCHTVMGGTHLAGFHEGVRQTIRKYLSTQGLSPGQLPLLDDVREGLTAVLFVRLAEPQYESQTRILLTNSEVRPFVSRAVRTQMLDHLNSHPDQAEAILERIRDAAAQKKA